MQINYSILQWLMNHRETERQRERQRDRERDRERDRQTKRETDRQTNRHRTDGMDCVWLWPSGLISEESVMQEHNLTPTITKLCWTTDNGGYLG